MTDTLTKKLKRFKKRKWLIALIVLLIAVRMALPTLVKNYVNDVLADIPGYKGSVEDIDLSIIRGAYVIQGLTLNTVEAETEIPFLSFPNVDISIEWKSLFKGQIVSEIFLDEPTITYVLEDQDQDTVTVAEQEDWTVALKDLVPIDINHFEITNGTIALVGVQADPNIDLDLKNLDLFADNLRNVSSKEERLPSEMRISAVSFGEGNFRIDGKMNLLKEIPDMDLVLSLEKSDVRALNDLTNYYAKMDFEKGEFNLYSELVIADNYLKGYIKPFLSDTKLISKNEPLKRKAWEGFLGFFKFVFKNQRTDAVAMKIPFEGDLDNVDTKTWSTIMSIIKNAWVEALETKSDNEIEFGEVLKKSKQ